MAWPVWVAVFAGFGGVVITLDPSAAAWSWAALLPVIGAFAAALRDILTRRLSARETSGAIMFYSMTLMVACASLSAPFGWRWPDALDLLLFLAVGFLVGGAHTLMIEGIRLDSASGGGLRFPQLFAAGTILVCTIAFVYRHRPGSTS